MGAGREGVSAAQDLRLRVRAPLKLSTSTSTSGRFVPANIPFSASFVSSCSFSSSSSRCSQSCRGPEDGQGTETFRAMTNVESQMTKEARNLKSTLPPPRSRPSAPIFQLPTPSFRFRQRVPISHLRSPISDLHRRARALPLPSPNSQLPTPAPARPDLPSPICDLRTPFPLRASASLATSNFPSDTCHLTPDTSFAVFTSATKYGKVTAYSDATIDRGLWAA